MKRAVPDGLPAAARWFRASHRAQRGLERGVRGAIGLARAVHSGLWLGGLSEQELQALDRAAYAGPYAYHGSDDHNLRGLFPWEQAAVDECFPRTGRVLVTSAGGGREVLALRRRGYEVVSFECNAELRRVANETLSRAGYPGDVAEAERDACPDPAGTGPGSVDAAIVGWGAYTYVRGAARRARFLSELRALLRPGAPVLLSFYAREPGSRSFALSASVGNLVARAIGRERLEPGDVLDPTFQHYFLRTELEAELLAAGMVVERYETVGFAHAVARVR